MSTIRGIYIQPTNREITEIQLEEKDLFKQLYKLCNCDMIQVVRRNSKGRELYLHIDEEGRFKGDKQTAFAIRVDELAGEGEEFLGPAVILGAADKKGDTLPAPEWCTVKRVRPLVMWAAQSHANFPDHWLVKILMISGKDSGRFSCIYMNPYMCEKLQIQHPGLSSKELRVILEKNEALGSIDYEPQDFGFSATRFDETIEAAPTDDLTMSIITATLETIRKKVAAEVLKIDPNNLFLMREPLTSFTDQEKGKP